MPWGCQFRNGKPLTISAFAILRCSARPQYSVPLRNLQWRSFSTVKVCRYKSSQPFLLASLDYYRDVSIGDGDYSSGNEAPTSATTPLKRQLDPQTASALVKNESLEYLSHRAKYREVQEKVTKLLIEGESKKQDDIYEALLLANTDCWHGSSHEIVNILQDMVDEGAALDSNLLHTCLKVLAVHPHYLLQGFILEEMRQRWISLNENGWQFVVAGFVRERQFEQALESFDHMRHLGFSIQPWLYDMVVYVLCEVGEFDEILQLAKQRLEYDDLSLSSALWVHVLDQASRALHHPLTEHIFRSRVLNSYMNPSVGMLTNVLQTAARVGDVSLATTVFDVVSQRKGNLIQLHHYEALIETYIEAEDLDTALAILCTIKSAGLALLDSSTRPIFRYLCVKLDHVDRAHRILNQTLLSGRSIPIEALNVVIEGFTFHGATLAAVDVYRSVAAISADLVPNLTTFEILLQSCQQHSLDVVASELALDMIARGLKPSAETYELLILTSINSDYGLDVAWRYRRDMETQGWSLSAEVAAALANATRDAKGVNPQYSSAPNVGSSDSMAVIG